MTREELKEHCEKQIEMCEMWAIAKGEKPTGKVYEEHKLILELLEQQPCEDAPSAQPKMGHWINKKPRWIPSLSMTMHDAYECSNCGEPGIHWWKHCINCGVRMIEPQESEDKA